MEFLFAGGIAAAIITAFVLLTSRSNFPRHANILFSVYLLSSAYCALLYILVSTGQIIEIPHLFKTAAPLNFILPPLSYLYVRAVLMDESKIQVKDYLHFIPFLFILLAYLPFYFQDRSIKLEFIHLANGNSVAKIGFIREDLQFVLRQLQAGVYIFLQWRLISRFTESKVPVSLRAFTHSVLNWLKAIVFINLLLFLSFFVVAFLMADQNRNSIEELILQFSIAFFALGYFLLVSYLLLNPTVLYGLDARYTTVGNKVSIAKAEKILSNTSVFEEEQNLLYHYFEVGKPYLQKNLSISAVSVATGIPARSISYILNSQQGTRFTDYVNGFRVREAAREIEQGFLATYTLSSLAEKTGFSSVRSLNRAFQRHFNMSPTSYLSKSSNS
jgi:AraC-like DNA-binding protein